MSSSGSEPAYTTESFDLVVVEAMVRTIMSEMVIINNSRDSDTTVSTKTEDMASLSTISETTTISSDTKNSRTISRNKSKSTKTRKSKMSSSSSSTKDKKENSKAKINEKKISQIKKLLAELEKSDDSSGSTEGQHDSPPIPRSIFVENQTSSDKTVAYITCDGSTTVSCLTTSVHSRSSTIISSTATVGTIEFYNDVAFKLRPHRNSICIQGGADCIRFEDDKPKVVHDNNNDNDDDDDFQAAFGPTDMRCLALVSHNEMKSTMKDFVIHYKHILKKFRLTGTQSTMKMLAEMFADEPDIVFGPSCNSGPLGGDAELVDMMVSGCLGGILFFQDPMSSHPHQADIECLVRQAQVHNTVIAITPTTAMTIMEVFRMALMGEGKPELIPSFFLSLQSPTVEAYRNSQKKEVRSRS